MNDFLTRLGLPLFKAASFYRILASNHLLGAYSSTVIPHPRDWPDTVHITGYRFLEEAGKWQPQTGLEGFLQTGDSPVYVGFGSMGAKKPEQLASIIILSKSHLNNF